VSFSFDGTAGKYLSSQITAASDVDLTMVCYAQFTTSTQSSIKAFSYADAATALSSTTDTVAIGRGYSSPNHFCRAFPEATNTSATNATFVPDGTKWWCLIGQFDWDAAMAGGPGFTDTNVYIAEVGTAGPFIAPGVLTTNNVFGAFPDTVIVGAGPDLGARMIGLISDVAIYESLLTQGQREALLTYAPNMTAQVGATPVWYRALQSALTDANDIGTGGLVNTGSVPTSATNPSLTRSAGASTTRGMPFGNRSTVFNGGRIFTGPIN
jgi:hypothetical protein